MFYFILQLINNVILVLDIQQSDLVIHIHVSILFKILFPFKLLLNYQSCLCYSSLFLQSVQSLSRVQLFATSRTAAHQLSLSITNSRSQVKLTSIESVMPSNDLIFCCPILLLPSIFPSIRVFSNESVLHIRQPKYQSFSFSISPSNEYSGPISFRMGWFDLFAV